MQRNITCIHIASKSYVSWNNRRGKDLSTDTAPVFVQKVLLFAARVSPLPLQHKFQGTACMHFNQQLQWQTRKQSTYYIMHTHIHTDKISKEAFEWPFCCSFIQPPGRTYRFHILQRFWFPSRTFVSLLLRPQGLWGTARIVTQSAMSTYRTEGAYINACRTHTHTHTQPRTPHMYSKKHSSLLLFPDRTTGQDLSIDTARCFHRSFRFLMQPPGRTYP